MQKKKSVPVCLDIVAPGISDDSLEDDFRHRRQVHQQTLSQDLQAGQKSVTELTGLYRKGPHQHVH